MHMRGPKNGEKTKRKVSGLGDEDWVNIGDPNEEEDWVKVMPERLSVTY